MTDSETPAAATRDPDQLPRHTTPTWEVELLISGVAVFAMLQLPGWLDNQMFALMPRLDADLAGIGLSLYLYLKSAAVILAVTFAMHLLLRAHWIALVGMHSVYPDGVLWEKLRMGPIQREIEQRRRGCAAESIERADNRATVVFAIGVMLATRLLQIGLVFAVLFTLLLIGATLTGARVNLFLLLSICLASIILLMLLSRRIDRMFGQGLRRNGLPRRALAKTFRLIAHAGIGRRSEVMALLASHGSERRINLMTVVIFAVLFTAMTFGMRAMTHPAQAGSYGLFPHSVDDSRSLRSSHYDDQRDALHGPATPFVQSAVIDGAYLRLTVPYQPQIDAPAQRSQCASALAMPAGEARAAAMLDCLARLHAVSLDGQPLAALHYDIGSDPRTERPALQAMIDVRSLASGRHLLRIARAPTSETEDQGDDADVIAFWR
ncbi:MAG: hypothetical protein ABI178_10240 [Rhodanobacter sp.]